MPTRRTRALILMLAGGTAVLAAAPAGAQVYYRPYGGVYVERYYGPPPGDYAPPAYGPPPGYDVPRRTLPPQDVEPLLRSMGMRFVGRVRVDGGTYVVEATDAAGARQSVRLDAVSGEIIAMHRLSAGAPVVNSAPPAGEPPMARSSQGRRYATPEEAGTPVFPPPLPPKRPPELAALPAPAPAVTEPASSVPAAASPAPESPLPEPAQASPAAGADAPKPDEAAKPADAPPAQAEKPAAPADSRAAAQPGAVRVIPGVAVPPGTAPGTGTGTGTATGDSASAGTASVVVRDRPAAAAAP